ncbi:hypothetical protein Scep_015876 [Stephania cephalantha]|uniref:Uncharacterized protein n=1 Tax=Stephania cephalantha TaxID=152367 RepID=A0AAP0IMR7_9MAGN
MLSLVFDEVVVVWGEKGKKNEMSYILFSSYFRWSFIQKKHYRYLLKGNSN